MTQQFFTNQFAQQAVKGTLAKTVNFAILPARLIPTSTNTLYGATAVKLVTGGSPNQIYVNKAAANDPIYAFVLYSKKKNQHGINTPFLSSDSFDIARRSNIMWMEAGAAITRGQTLEFSPAVGDDADTVIPFANTGNTIIGVALTDQPSVGGVVQVEITVF